MNRAFHRNASKLRRQLGTDSCPVIDCTGAKQVLLQKLAAIRAGMAQEDPRYNDPNFSPYSEEERARIMSNLTESLDASIAEKEEQWNARFVSRSTDD